MKRILLIHGWLHTADVYNSLKTRLSNYEVVLWKIDGMDNNNNCITEQLIKQLQEHIRHNHYDLIIAHSVGCYILLHSINEEIKSKVILLNPVYGNYKWYVRLIIPMLTIGLNLSKSLYRRNPNSKLILLLALFTCNKAELINDTITMGIGMSNTNLCSSIIRESITTYNVYCNSIVVVHSKHDRLLTKPIKLIENYDCDYYELDCGHSSFIEEENSVLWIIQRIINY